MNRTNLPNPPDPADPQYSGSLRTWQRAVFDWMQQSNEAIETDSAVNVVPMAPFAVASYTAVNTMTGTDALSNFVATLVSAMQAKGLTTTRTTT